MTERSPTAGHPPLSRAARNRLVRDAVTANLVTRLGARVATAKATEQWAGSPGGACG
jgi:hypothetical protein